MVNDVRNTHMVEGDNTSKVDMAEKDDEIQHTPFFRSAMALPWLMHPLFLKFLVTVDVVDGTGPRGPSL